MQLRLPPELVERARRLAADGSWTVPPARPAATVALLRDSPDGLQVMLMRRPATMAFAPGIHVFPGGRVELDSDLQVPLHGEPPLGTWVQDEAAPARLARALIAAAARETFEEAGVLLAVDPSGKWAEPDADWEADRVACESAGFPEVLARRGLAIPCQELVPFAHWVTPEVETRRFDTRFLLAALPVGQLVVGHATETETAVWIRPEDALVQYLAGELAMLPPTVAALADLAAQPDTAAALRWGRSRSFVPLMPRPVIRGDQVEWVLVNPYTGEVGDPVGEPAGSEERGAAT